MKKLTILFATVAMMAMTACNEKTAENNAATDAQSPAVKTEQQASAPDSTEKKPEIKVERIQPTNDGKETVMTEFTDAKGTKVKMVNKGDGTINVSIKTNGKGNYDIVTKNCVASGNSYLLESADGTKVLLDTTPGKEDVTVIKGQQIAYSTKK